MAEPAGDRRRKANEIKDLHENMAKMTIVEQYQYMLENGILTDCTFVVGPEDGKTREFKGHRLHIARVSPVFAAMLLGSEMSEAKSGHVRVTDLSPDTFSLLLNSIYGKEPEAISYEEAQDLAFAADKYQMKALQENCVTRMRTLITHENIWTALETVDLLQEARLKETCVQVLQCDTLRCIADPGFTEASEENVALLLEQNELNVDDELLLVISIVHWARHAARERGLSDDDNGVRAVLEPRLLSLFRFLTMSPQQFMLGLGLAGWLTDDEKSSISECLQSRDFSELPLHLSAVARKRKNVIDIAETDLNLGGQILRKFICRREIIDSSEVPNVEESYICDSCQLHTDLYSKCLHTYLIFRVTSVCKLLGFQCASRCSRDSVPDPTALWAKNPVYQENIVANVSSFNHTLSTSFKKILVAKKQMDNQQAEYNSNITVMFDKPIPLVTDNWFALEVIYRHDSNVPAGQYPNPLRDQSIDCTAAAVEVVFFTEQLDGCYYSWCDGVFESLIFSL